MNMCHHGISLFMSSIVILAHLWCPGSISHTYWNTRNHNPYEGFYVLSGEICKLQRKLILTRPHCFHSIERLTKHTKPSMWFKYILLCKITLFVVYFQYPKVLRHKCPVIGSHYLSSTQKTLHNWSTAVNSKASYWCYTCMVCFPHIILSCCRCRRMRPFVPLITIRPAIQVSNWWNFKISNTKLLRQEIHFSITLPTINPTWTILSLNLGLHGYNLLTNHLICSSAFPSLQLLMSIGNYCMFVSWLVQTLKWSDRLVD
jgi:hypothetical protein